MANRPKMKTMQNELSAMRNTLDDHEARLKQIEEREIISMLQESNIPGSSKPRYTYQEIADFVGVSPSTVSNIASKNNLSRRNLG